MKIPWKKVRFLTFFIIMVIGVATILQEVTTIPFIPFTFIKWPSLGLIIIVIGLISAIPLLLKN